MKRKLATLDIFVEDREKATFTGESSSTEMRPNPLTGNWEVTLRPEADIAIIDSISGKKVKPDAASVLSHEIGHVVAMIAKDVSHDPEIMFRYGIAPVEAKAWALARTMNPEINWELERVTVESQRRDDAQAAAEVLVGPHSPLNGFRPTHWGDESAPWRR